MSQSWIEFWNCILNLTQNNLSWLFKSTVKIWVKLNIRNLVKNYPVLQVSSWICGGLGGLWTRTWIWIVTKFILMISVESRVQCTVISPIITSEYNYCLWHVTVRINTNVLQPCTSCSCNQWWSAWYLWWRRESSDWESKDGWYEQLLFTCMKYLVVGCNWTGNRISQQDAVLTQHHDTNITHCFRYSNVNQQLPALRLLVTKMRNILTR